MFMSIKDCVGSILLFGFRYDDIRRNAYLYLKYALPRR